MWNLITVKHWLMDLVFNLILSTWLQPPKSFLNVVVLQLPHLPSLKPGGIACPCVTQCLRHALQCQERHLCLRVLNLRSWRTWVNTCMRLWLCFRCPLRSLYPPTRARRPSGCPSRRTHPALHRCPPHTPTHLTRCSPLRRTTFTAIHQPQPSWWCDICVDL